MSPFAKSVQYAFRETRRLVVLYLLSRALVLLPRRDQKVYKAIQDALIEMTYVKDSRDAD